MSFVDEAVNTGGNNAATVVIPAGASAGDLLIVVISLQADEVTAATTGLTLVTESDVSTASAGRMEIYKGVVTSGGALDASDTITLNLSSNSPWAISCEVYTDDDILGSPATSYLNSGSVASVTSPGISAPGPCIAKHIYGVLSQASATSAITWTPHANTTERVDVSCTAASGGGTRQGLHMTADETVSAAGAVPGRLATPSANVQGQAVTLLIGSASALPLADAGSDQTVNQGATVNLDGTASNGGGAPFTYQWTQTAGPAVSLSSATAENPSFTAPATGATLVFQLVVTDTTSASSLPDTVTITVLAADNTARPVTDQTVTGWLKEPSSAATVAGTIGDNTDATYAYYPSPGGTVALEVGLSGLVPPGAGQPVTVWFRPSMFEATSGSVVMSLKQGASTVIATFAAAEWSTADAVQLFQYELTSGQVAAITDWNALRLRWEGTVT